MSASRFSIWALALTLAAGTGGCANGETRPDAFSRDVPAALESSVESGMKQVAAEHPMARDVETRLLQKVRTIDPDRTESDRRQVMEEIHACGYGAISPIAGELISPDEKARRQAAIALQSFAGYAEAPPGYAQRIEPVVIALFHRSLLADKSAEVRRLAMRGLIKVAWPWAGRSAIRPARPIPAGLKEALETGANDPVEQIKEDAQLYLQRLGYRAPGAVGGKWID